MRQLYAQIVAAVGLAVVAGWAAVALLIPIMRRVVEESVRQQLLAMGIDKPPLPPLPPPPLAPLVITALVFTLVLTVTASAVVGIPLVRRLRRIGDAIGELGRGNWAMRMDPRAERPVSDLAESINRTASQLQQQFQEREALMQAVSHEMGTPLSRMRFELELLEQILTSPDQQQRLQALSADLDELDDLSTELVSWMEREPGSAMTSFDVRKVLEALVELEGHRSRSPVSVTLSAPPGVICLRADRRQFERAVENLLRNARRYAQQCIVADIGADPGAVIVEIRDDGPGIPRDQWTRVLEPFVRIDGSPRSHAHRGLGLGLAIVRRIVEGHGGEVSVGAAPEGGTCIRTTWPVRS